MANKITPVLKSGMAITMYYFIVILIITNLVSCGPKAISFNSGKTKGIGYKGTKAGLTDSQLRMSNPKYFNNGIR